MIFGKKPAKTEVQPQKADLEIVRPVKAKPLPVMTKAKDIAPSTFPGFEQEVKDEVEEEEEAEEVPEIAPAKPVVKKVAPKPVVEEEEQPVEEEKPQPVVAKPFAQILSGEILENGLHRYIVVSNKSIGKIGEIMDLE
jgi:hypothetical protein